MCAAQELGEQAGETETDGRHASTYYSDLAFDDGPYTGFEIIPRHVSRVREMYK